MKLCQSRKPSGTKDSHAASATAAPMTNHLASGRGSRAEEIDSVAARVITSIVPVRWPRRTTVDRRHPPSGSQRLPASRSEEHTSELQSHLNLVCRLLLEKKKKTAWSSKRRRRARSAC